MSRRSAASVFKNDVSFLIFLIKNKKKLVSSPKTDTVLYYKVFDHWMNLFMEIVGEKFEGKWNIPTMSDSIVE